MAVYQSSDYEIWASTCTSLTTDAMLHSLFIHLLQLAADIGKKHVHEIFFIKDCLF